MTNPMQRNIFGEDVPPASTGRRTQWKMGNNGQRKRHAPHRIGPGKTIAEYAREYTEDAIALMAHAVRYGKVYVQEMGEDGQPLDGGHWEEVPAKQRLYAANTLMDRGWGRPISTVELNREDKPAAPPEELSTEELHAIVASSRH